MSKYCLGIATKRSCLLIFTAVLLLLLPACTENAAQTESPIQEETISIVTPADYNVEIDPDGFSISFVANQAMVLLNGIEFTLSVPPLVQDDSLYIPLQDLVKLLGGSYSFQDNIASIQLWGRTVVFYIQQPKVEVDGVLYQLQDQPEWVDCFVSGQTHPRMEPANDYGPILLDGRAFLPNGMLTYLLNGASSIYSCYDEGMVLIYARFVDGERGTDSIRLMDEYNRLPDEIRAQYEYAGIVDKVLNYSILMYRNDAAAIYVMAAEEGTEDVDGMDGRVCAIHVYKNNVPTARGLQVFDTAYKAWLLYGFDGLTGSFIYQIESGCVENYTFYTRYFNPALLCLP